MGRLKKIGTEKNKLLFVSAMAFFCIVVFLVFCFKLPSTTTRKGFSLKEVPDYVIVSTNEVYEQKFKSDVSRLNSVSVLFDRDNNFSIKGKIKMSVFTDTGEPVGEYEYDANMIPPTNYVAAPIYQEVETKGKEYILQIEFVDLDNKDNLRMAYINDAKIDTYKLNDEDKKQTLVYSYAGEEGNKTFFWYPFMGLAMLIPLFATINYKKIKKEGSH